MRTARGTEENKMSEKINTLNESELENVNGGMVVLADGQLPEYDPTCPWEVVENNTGKLLGKFPTQAEACQYGKSFGPESYNAELVDIPTVLRLRANPQA